VIVLCGACGGDRPAQADGDDAAPPVKPSPPSRDITVPAGRRVQFEGRMPRAEWEDAVWRPLGTDGTLLALKQAQGTLLIGVRSPHAWPTRGNLWFLFAPDTEEAGLFTAGAIRLDYEPREHNRPHVMVWRRHGSAEELVEDAAVVRSATKGSGFTVEVALRLGLLDLEPGAAAPRRFAVVWVRGTESPTVTWPPGLQVGGAVGAVPPDLASSARWARLSGWTDLDGPGALSRTEWNGLLAEDTELTARGRDAHAMAMEIAEEGSLPKRDSRQVPQLVDNLQWIAAREPLTPHDLIALAQGYRFLNRPAEALAVLDALLGDPEWRASERLHYERAVTLQSMERFEEAAAVWDHMARTLPGQGAGRYERTAAYARAQHVSWQAEQEARAGDRAREDLPLVLLRTNRGDVLIQLFADDVPEATAHFLALATTREGDHGFYDGLLFHRVIGAFMAQGGDPQTRTDGCEVPGSGKGPRTIPIEENPRHGFWRGAVAFARGMSPQNGSQFFILAAPRTDLEASEFTVFGHVLAGMDVVDRLEQCDAILEVRVLHPGGATGTEPEEGEGER
jgi:cyclophilin family peptidyl-prolyl cis-trans isomerase